ncbi:hypothetical protein L227DRAFT_568566, partial [Lentinus tigrinus ALCF2SS1-6]
MDAYGGVRMPEAGSANDRRMASAERSRSQRSNVGRVRTSAPRTASSRQTVSSSSTGTTALVSAEHLASVSEPTSDQVFTVLLVPFQPPTLRPRRGAYPKSDFTWNPEQFDNLVGQAIHFKLIFTVTLPREAPVWKVFGEQVMEYCRQQDIVIPSDTRASDIETPTALPFVLLRTSNKRNVPGSKLHSPFDDLNCNTFTVEKLLDKALINPAYPRPEPEFASHPMLRIVDPAITPECGSECPDDPNTPSSPTDCPMGDVDRWMESAFAPPLSPSTSHSARSSTPIRNPTPALSPLQLPGFSLGDELDSSSPSTVGSPGSIFRELRPSMPHLEVPGDSAADPPTALDTAPSVDVPNPSLDAASNTAPDVAQDVIPAAGTAATPPLIQYGRRRNGRTSARMSTGGRQPRARNHNVATTVANDSHAVSDHAQTPAATSGSIVIDDATSGPRTRARAASANVVLRNSPTLPHLVPIFHTSLSPRRHASGPTAPLSSDQPPPPTSPQTFAPVTGEVPPPNRRRQHSPSPEPPTSASTVFSDARVVSLQSGPPPTNRRHMESPRTPASALTVSRAAPPLSPVKPSAIRAWRTRVTLAIRVEPDFSDPVPHIRAPEADMAADILIFLVRWLIMHRSDPIHSDTEVAFVQDMSLTFPHPGASCNLTTLSSLLRHADRLDIHIGDGIGDSPMRTVFRTAVQKLVADRRYWQPHGRFTVIRPGPANIPEREEHYTLCGFFALWHMIAMGVGPQPISPFLLRYAIEGCERACMLDPAFLRLIDPDLYGGLVPWSDYVWGSPLPADPWHPLNALIFSASLDRHVLSDPPQEAELQWMERQLVASALFGGTELAASDILVSCFANGMQLGLREGCTLDGTFLSRSRDYLAVMCSTQLDSVDVLIAHLHLESSYDREKVNAESAQSEDMSDASWDVLFED